jgi:hypothetical protein
VSAALRAQNSGLSNKDSALPNENSLCPQSILFKHDRIYSHSLMRINYTTYDVRRSQDVINASTSHCNVMLLADSSSDSLNSTPRHPFNYARVLGVHHVNVIYAGPGMVDYQPHRIEFLWVRWFQPLGTMPSGWTARKLDRVRFFPMADDDAFGFVDPSDVFRSCHIIPRFAKGQLHSDGMGLSRCA